MFAGIINKLMRAVGAEKPRYVKGTNSRAALYPETISEWRKRQHMIPFTAQGGWYIDADAREKARRRVERYLRNHPGASFPSHIADKGMRT